MKNRQGITLMVLIVTIVLVIVLMGTLAVNTGNTVGNSRISAFASDISEVEDATKTYYMLNGEIPTIINKTYTQGEILQLVPEKYQGKFVEELQANNDHLADNELGNFYKISLEKIGIEQSVRGTQKDDEGNTSESDVYVVSYPSFNIYYLEGIRANRDVFFSLSSKITQLTNIVRDETVEEGTTSLTTSNGIIVKKESNEWSNDINIIIESNMQAGETLNLQLGLGQKHAISTTVGNNILQINNGFKTVYSNTNKTQSNSGITDEEINNFNLSPQQNKNIVITKEKDGQVIGKVVVSLQNYEADLPRFSSNVTIKSEDTFNYVRFNAKDITSGVEQVRYEYLKEIDEEGNSIPYYENISEFDEDYMKVRAKKATISSNGLVEIKLPKDIDVIQINIFDKAGNSSSSVAQKIIKDVYLGINEKEVTTTSLELDMLAKFSGVQNITSANVQISTDGVNYIKNRDLEFENVSKNMLFKSTIKYDDLTQIKDVIYVKLEVNYGENSTVTRIKEIKVNTIKV